MKKLLVIVLGLGIALGTVSFAQETKDGDKKMDKKGKKKKGDDDRFETLEVMQFKLKLKDGLIYLGTEPKPKQPGEENLMKKFNFRYEETKQIFKGCLLSWTRKDEELNRKAFHMYEEFRPTVEPGQGGWGRKGELQLDKVSKVATK